MSKTNQESVKLIIEAENISNDEFKEASAQVKALSKESDIADKALQQLKVDQATIKSYGELGQEIDDLKIKILDAKTAQAAAKKEFSSSSTEYKKAANNVQVLGRDLKSLNKLYNTQGTALKNYRTDSAAVAQTTIDLNEKIQATEAVVTAQKAALVSANATMETAAQKTRELSAQKTIAIAKEVELSAKVALFSHSLKAQVVNQRKANKAFADSNTAKAAAIVAAKKLAASQLKERQAIEGTEAVVAMYAKKLAALNKERNEGNATSSQFIRSEAKLRAQLKLSKAAVADTVKIMEKENAEAKAKIANDAKLIASMKAYEKELTKLNIKKNKGEITTEELAQAEVELREKYKLSTAQVKKNSTAILANNKAIKKAKSSTDLLTTTTRRLAQAYTVLLAAGKVVDVIGASVEQFGAVEGAMVKVEKTTNLAHAEVTKLKNSLNEMAENVTPTATKELLNYAEVAGQLGVSSKQGILDLAVAADALGVSTDLAGDEAVTLLTRMLLMSKEGIGGIHNLSSAVVELGNNFAASESEIVLMGKEVLTSTASINMGTDAAVAFGATLKESGQTAERSRTAIQRLALMIKKASVEGGEDLQKLTKITGMTADAIQKGLGEEPEQVLLAFVQGLNKIKEAGGVVSTALEDMGVKSLESQAVLEVLGDQSLRLADALAMAGRAAQEADKHLIESSKAYATQESAIGRLNNKLKTLQERMGEAFSADTNAAVNKTTEAISEYEEAILEMGQMFADTMNGVIELLAPLGDAFDKLGEGVSKVAYTFKLLFNFVQDGLDAITLFYQKYSYYMAKIFGESDEQLKYLADAADNTVKRMQVNQQDIANSIALFNGETSLSYIKLRETIEGNEKAVASLTEREQLQLKGLMRKGAYNEADNAIYREKTALITLQVRTLKIAESQGAQIAKDKASRAFAEKKAAQEMEVVNEKAYKLQMQLFTSGESFVEYQKKLIASYVSGAIKVNEYKEKLAVTNQLIKIQKESTDELTTAVAGQNAETVKAINNANSSVTATKLETEAGLALIETIQGIEEAINKQKVAQVGLEETSEKYLSAQEKINELNDELTASTTELNTVHKLEDMTQSELLIVQEKNIKQIAKLKALRDADKITIQEYNAGVDALATTTSFLSDNIEEVNARTQKKIEKSKLAQEQDAISALTLDELITLQQQHINLLADIEFKHEQGVISTEEYNKKTAELAVTTEFLAKNYEKLVEQKEKEAKTSADAAIQNELEGLTLQELINKQKDHQAQLDELLKKYQSGQITWGEYQEAVGEMKTMTDALTTAIGDNTKAMNDNVIAAKAMSESAKETAARNAEVVASIEKSNDRFKGSYTAVQAVASAFDTTTASASELSDEIEVLEKRIDSNAQVMSPWWKNIAQSQIAFDKESLSIAETALRVENLSNKFEDLENPTRSATEAILKNVDSLGDLDNATLDSLRDEVEETIDAFDDMRNTIKDSISDVEERLLDLKGQSLDLLDYQQAAELESAQELATEATGDDEAVEMANQYIEKLKEAQAIERSNLVTELAAAKVEAAEEAIAAAEELAAATTDKTEADTAVSTATSTTASSSASSSSISTTGMQQITINVGTKSTSVIGDKDDIISLLDSLGYTAS